MSNAELQELARQERNRYHKEWRAKNRDKIRENNRRYWERKALRAAEQEAENGANAND